MAHLYRFRPNPTPGMCCGRGILPSRPARLSAPQKQRRSIGRFSSGFRNDTIDRHSSMRTTWNHTPCCTPLPEFRERFVSPGAPSAIGSPRVVKLARSNGVLSDDQLQAMIDLYDAEIAAADAALLELFNALQERGFSANLLMVLVSNYGEDFGDHGEWFHGLKPTEPNCRSLSLSTAAGVRRPLATATHQSICSMWQRLCFVWVTRRFPRVSSDLPRCPCFGISDRPFWFTSWRIAAASDSYGVRAELSTAGRKVVGS